MRKIGITVDNYKIETFVTNLKAKGFNEVQIFPMTSNTTLLRVLVEDDKFTEATAEIRKICAGLQLTFARKQ